MLFLTQTYHKVSLLFIKATNYIVRFYGEKKPHFDVKEIL